MTNKFYTTTASNEVDEIKSELLAKGFTEATPCGKSNNLFIDTSNMMFWNCDQTCMETNKKMARQFHGEETEQVTLKEIKSWQN